ncbi:hypothetical protein [uncultured Microscilla sp.]|uniref:hypothetical protein n=1 Tax=uncultured Microscilla sp. TaxID=432653 RepID=UPI002639429D|nr:hypothetical protein [uncultured Microscilla sp.]
MIKPSSSPVMYTDFLQLSLGMLKKEGFFEVGQWIRGSFELKHCYSPSLQTMLEVNLYSTNPYLELRYNYNGKSRYTKIDLVNIPSNLGKGKVWFFVCPVTGKHCRKLHYVNGYFMHRTAFKGFYRGQIESKASRWMYKAVNDMVKGQAAQKMILSGKVLGSYAGKPTKRYLRLQKQIAKATVCQDKT